MSVTASPSQFCIHCGQPLPGRAVFCSRCGRPTGLSQSAPVEPPTTAPEVPHELPATSEAPSVRPSAAQWPPTAPAQPPGATVGNEPDPAAPNKRPRMTSLLMGAATGAAVAAIGVAAVVLGNQPPARVGQPVTVSLEVLPKSVAGRERADLEQDKLGNTSSADTLRRLAGATIASYADAFGGDGIEMAYGVYADRELQLVVVNGGLNLELPQSAIETERLNVVQRPVMVAASRTTQCQYTPPEPVRVDGQNPVDVIAQVANTGPASGKLTCLRADSLRNFSVQLSGKNVSTESPTDAAKEIAAEVDRIWQGMAG